jgi:hypothetical protein
MFELAPLPDPQSQDPSVGPPSFQLEALPGTASGTVRKEVLIDR